MRKMLMFAFVLVASAAVAHNAQALKVSPDNVPRMSVQQLKKQMNNPDLIIIDVRIPEDWDESTTKIKGAAREDPEDPDSWMAKYSPEKTLVFYCA